MGDFTAHSLRVALRLAPEDMGDVAAGIRRQLDQRLYAFCDELGGVPVSYSRVKVEQRCGVIVDDLPGVHVATTVAWRVFTPAVGALLVGEVNKVSPDHVGLLVHRHFNASIGRDEIGDGYEFDASEDCWADKNFDAPHISAGTRVTFRVSSLSVANGVLAIVGSMLSADTGCAPLLSSPSKRDCLATLPL